jgi:hypothetical protein
MNYNEFLNLLTDNNQRFEMIGSPQSGVIVTLDCEGRLFVVLDGEVLHRVNPEAFSGMSTRDEYLNPGGDVLWPAPEGSSLGYEYSTGGWRVPPGITSARYQVVERGESFLRVSAEIDLINNSGIGIPTLFERALSMKAGVHSLNLSVEETIHYIGSQTLSSSECLLVPWTLCQFDVDQQCEVVFPDSGEDAVRDLYASSETMRYRENGYEHFRAGGDERYQIALDGRVPWLTFSNPQKNILVKRSAEPLQSGFTSIDIADSDPAYAPTDKGVSLSAYSDPSLFMEIEACGGTPLTYEPGSRSTVVVVTNYLSGTVQ